MSLRRAAAVVSLAALLLVAGAGAAAAHVTVTPTSAAAGSYTTVTFKVPTESDSASTVKVQVTLPRDHPLPSVSVAQVPGWTATITKSPIDPPVTEGRFTLTEAVTAVTWEADGGAGIKPGFFGQFSLSVGPLPDVTALRFPAVQTYSDGSEVRWDQVANGGDEPDHPAPTITVMPASAGSAGSGGAYSSSAVVASPDTTARILGLVALVLGAAALLLAALGVRRRRAPVDAAPRSASPGAALDEAENHSGAES